MEIRLGVVAIVVENDRESAIEIQENLSDFAEIIVGRMGIPDKMANISVISLIVKGSVEKISALTGKLGKLKGVTVKSAVTSVVIS